MITMSHRLLRTCNKCCLSTLLWSLAGWLVFLQIYHTLFPSSAQLPEPQDVWQKESRNFFPDVYPDMMVGRPEMVASQGKVDRPMKKVPAILDANVSGVVPTLRNKTRNRAEEEAKEKAALRKLALLFPGSELSIDGSKNNISEKGYYYPGRVWRDVDGKPIQSHGGGVLYVAETRTFYWYGENKGGPTYHLTKRGTARVDVLGISCYSSKDLWTWKFEGLALKPEKKDKSSDLYLTNVVERPKVIYNERTKHYVMWMHIDNANYSKAAVGVAISTQPEGPFDYLGSKRPHSCDSRDMTIFKDDNGDAYIIYSSQTNSELHIGTLTEDYMDVVERGMKRILIKQHREAPAVFKHQNIYYMVTSGCTGWNPNSAEVHAAESMMGSWETLGDPCVGGDEEFRAFTFFSQGSFVLPLPGLSNVFIFLADRWRPANLRDSRYIWLPLTMDGPVDKPLDKSFKFPQWQRVSIHWQNRWKLPQGWDIPQSRRLP